MQVSVSNVRFRKSKKRLSKSVISTILILIFAVSISAVLVVSRKKSLAFDDQYFYFVSCDSSKNSADLSSKKELVKNLGGAGVVFNNELNFYLVANVYLDTDSADEICKNLLGYFSKAKVIKIKTKMLDKYTKKQIKSNLDLRNEFQFLFDYARFYQSLQFKFLSGKCNESEFLSNLIEKRRTLEYLCGKITTTDDVSVNILNYGELFVLQLTNFLNNFYLSKDKQSYVCDYFVGFVINYLELYNSL